MMTSIRFLCQLKYDDTLKTWINVSQIVSGRLGFAFSHPEEFSPGLQEKIQSLNEHLAEEGWSIEDVVKMMEKLSRKDAILLLCISTLMSGQIME